MESLPAVTFMNMSFLKSCCSCRVVVALLVGTIALSPLCATLAGMPKTGDRLPDLAGFGLEGTMPELKDKVVLIDFWASWCGPCKKSFPVMKELHEKFGPRGFVVVAVSLDEQKSAMETFLKRTAPPFVVLRDATGRLAEAAGIEKMPTSFLLGADGKVIAVHSGFDGETTRMEYLTQIEATLKAAGK